MKQFCRTYSEQHCNCKNGCPEGMIYELNCAGCGEWHWVDHEGYRVKLEKSKKGKWVREPRGGSSACMPPQHVNCRCAICQAKAGGSVKAPEDPFEGLSGMYFDYYEFLKYMNSLKTDFERSLMVPWELMGEQDAFTETKINESPLPGKVDSNG